MSKGLEALEKWTNYKCSRMSEKIECKEIIEKELKALEIIKVFFKGRFSLHERKCMLDKQGNYDLIL